MAPTRDAALVPSCPTDAARSCAAARRSSFTQISSSAALDFAPGLLDFSGPASTALTVLVALAIGISAQGFINSMLEGDRGLGAFLSDGKGYGRSGFKPRNQQGEEDKPLGGPDPLPWLKLPELDFVEVAGQVRKSQQETAAVGGMDPEEEAQFLMQLEYMADSMRVELRAGNVREAEAIRDRLERLMTEYGIEYEEGFQ